MAGIRAPRTGALRQLLAQEEVWIRKGVEARRTRNEGRVRRLERLRVERAERRERVGNVSLALAEGQRSGKLVAELEHVGKRFGDKTVVDDYSTTILRGDRIGIIGPNGAGKTTLLKLILGEMTPDSGNTRMGTNVEVAYFDQMRAQLDENATLVDIISPGSEWVEIGGTRKHVMSYLGDFLFSPARAGSPVRSLSGGERARLLLARLFARPANVLVLDEPTNDLDIETLELLEELLQEYSGTVLLVSHDRAFLNNVVTQTIASEGDGRWRDYVGGYDEWLVQRPAPAAPAADTDKASKPALDEAAARQGRQTEAGARREDELLGTARTGRPARRHRRARGAAGRAGRQAGRRQPLPGRAGGGGADQRRTSQTGERTGREIRPLGAAGSAARKRALTTARCMKKPCLYIKQGFFYADHFGRPSLPDTQT